MSKMFKSVTKTWNPVIGCLHGCTYCWAKTLAEGKLKAQKGKYIDGFKPKLIEKELSKIFKAAGFVFVTDMGDLWGSWVPSLWIQKVLAVESACPETQFLNQTKNPLRFLEFEDCLPENSYAGVTIETNRNYHMSWAPEPQWRYMAMAKLHHPKKFVSIEPIMDFDLSRLLSWVTIIQPLIIEIGADNYKHNLPEPSPSKLTQLLYRLRQICPEVAEKDGLERLL